MGESDDLAIEYRSRVPQLPDRPIAQLPDPLTTTIYKSVYHPGEAPRALVVARAQAQPVGLALLGVFVVAFVGILRGEAVLGTLLWAVPLTYAAAAAWALYDLHRRPAEIVLRGGFGAVRSVWDVAWGREQPAESVRLQPVFRPFRKDGQLHVGVGDTIHTLRPDDWPKFSPLLDDLRATSDELASLAA